MLSAHRARNGDLHPSVESPGPPGSCAVYTVRWSGAHTAGCIPRSTLQTIRDMVLSSKRDLDDRCDLFSHLFSIPSSAEGMTLRQTSESKGTNFYPQRRKICNSGAQLEATLTPRETLAMSGDVLDGHN